MSCSHSQTRNGKIAPFHPKSLPGTYVLIFSSSTDRVLQVGQLGQFHVRDGFYVYVGSAFGPGGVQARVSHHRQPSQRLRWHIDYIKSVLRLEETWWTHDPVQREHQWAATIHRMHGASIPLHGFGASDCACDTHLYFFVSPPAFADFCKYLRGEVRRTALDKRVAPKAPLRFLWGQSPVSTLAV